MKNMGVAGPASSKEAAKSSVLPTTYLLPNVSSTKCLPGKKSTYVFISHKIKTLEKQRSIAMEGCTQGHGVGTHRTMTNSKNYLVG